MRGLVDIVLFFVMAVSTMTLITLHTSGNIVSDREKHLLKESVALKQQCEKPLPRTQQCVLQYIPEQQ